jgi:hypothetical protein
VINKIYRTSAINGIIGFIEILSPINFSLNPTANVEHKFLGFVVLTIGAWLTLLTLAGADAGRAAARAERFLRGLFF